MNTAVYVTKPFMSGRSQAIRIPVGFHITAPEVVINKVGDSIVITPKDSLQNSFMKGLLMLTDDFMKDGRPEET
ncbi:MAG: AbrB/MazE/SpoVT family DNA-binding domain-containing protein [Spirochaetales bacterium]|nr:AbrB/MazE/SpoVT family DNA-binding domain-containing protein [Spirochaetales bacterium]